MKKILSIILAITVISCNSNNNKNLSSPDGKINIDFRIDNGVPSYSVKKNNSIIVNDSEMGILFSDGTDLSSNLSIKSSSQKSFNEDWHPLYGEEEKINNHYNELKISLTNQNNEFDIIFRAYDDGIAFKYVVPEQKNFSNYNIIDEKTEFNLSSKDSALWIPAFSYRRYEFLHAFSSVDDISKEFFSKHVEDISYDTLGIDAAHTPLTIKMNDGSFISIHEANLVDFSSMTLAPRGGGNLEVELYPWADGIKVKSNNGINSPWRTIQIANSSSDLLNSNLILISSGEFPSRSKPR